MKGCAYFTKGDELKNLAALTIAVAALTAMPLAAHAIELTPGTWQDIETGAENGKPCPAATDTG